MTPASDAHRQLYIARLRAARDMMPVLRGRYDPDQAPEFDQWRQGVSLCLDELFQHSHYSFRFAKVRYRGPGTANWRSGLNQAETIIVEALEEAELGPGPESVSLPVPSPTPPGVVITVQNTFSPTVHIELAQVMMTLDRLSLTPSEREVAEEKLRELDAEMKGPARWPIMATAIESLKSIGKGVYKEAVVPLVVEFLKRQMIGGPSAL